ncbi:MAG: asparagine synthase (glutamine-hydrolyzing) [Deltaproteobacteria bacterium]|nr:asparagine synthase (glutamine-hydrolyzing) [Deltaproteobacteria bacterium]
MSRISGIISYNLSEDETHHRLAQMGDLQTLRGTEDKKDILFAFGSGFVGLGFRQVSTFDLETGMQPIVSQEDKSAIVCNGRIYNYLELKAADPEMSYAAKGDIEVALNMYRKHGLGFLNMLNGMYAGAIYDKLNSKLILFRDRFGVKPLYYTEWDNSLFFTSEIKPLFKGSMRPIEINLDRVETFFKYRYVPGTETMFNGIKKLLPGSYLEYNLDNRNCEIKRYWEYRLDRVIPDMKLEEASEEFIRLFRDAVKIRMRSDTEVGSLLSGGIDSSAVSSEAAVIKPDIRLFSISFNEERYNELPLINDFLEKNAQRFKKTKHHAGLCGPEMLNQLPDLIKSIEEPISLGTILPTDQVCRMAGQRVKAVLTGEGADEIFAGYRKFVIEAAASEYKTLPLQARKELDRQYPELNSYMQIRSKEPVERYIQSELLFTDNELKELIGKDQISGLFPQDAIPCLSGTEHPLNSAIAMETKARLPDYVNIRLDKLSMRHSLEARTPFLDYRLADFAATLPIHFKVNLAENREKYICSYSYARHSILDKESAFRKKQPFTIPMADWLSDVSKLPECIKEVMSGEMVEKQGIISQDILKKHIRLISNENVGPQTLVSEADKVYAIIIFTLW